MSDEVSRCPICGESNNGCDQFGCWNIPVAVDEVLTLELVLAVSRKLADEARMASVYLAQQGYPALGLALADFDAVVPKRYPPLLETQKIPA